MKQYFYHLIAIFSSFDGFDVADDLLGMLL